MSNEFSPFSAEPDPELGRALRDALTPPFHEAFVGRVMARLRAQPQASASDVLARWFWQGLVAASLAVVAAGWSISGGDATDQNDEASVTASAAEQLLSGQQAMGDVVIASLVQERQQ